MMINKGLLVTILITLLIGCDDNLEFIPSTEPLNLPDTLGKFTDERDGKTYSFVTIGYQTWMAENLRFKNRKDDSCSYQANPVYGEVYGYLYSVNEAIKDSLCPSGWELPSDATWKELELRLGMPAESQERYLGVNDWGPRPKNWGEVSGYEGERIKSKTSHWKEPNLTTSKESLLHGLPGGYWSTIDFDYHDIGVSAMFLTADYDSLVTIRHLSYYSRNIDRIRLDTAYRFSVRCIKKTSSY